MWLVRLIGDFITNLMGVGGDPGEPNFELTRIDDDTWQYGNYRIYAQHDGHYIWEKIGPDAEYHPQMGSGRTLHDCLDDLWSMNDRPF